ncbi:MAG: hypothetical protein M0P70_12150 [Desulfobulbaceae bacterium]|nr:hypothetical protein [Desulfobulbaceae bacterium]
METIKGGKAIFSTLNLILFFFQGSREHFPDDRIIIDNEYFIHYREKLS